MIFFPMKFFFLKPVAAGAVEAAELGSADLLSIPLSTSISFAMSPSGRAQLQTTSSPHTSPLHCQYSSLFPCPASNWAEGKHASTRSCS